MAYEDYTDYTEVDPNNRFTVTTNKIEVAALQGNEDAWIYDDKGSSHFATTFEHDVKVRAISGTAAYASVGCWAVTNTIEDIDYLRDNLSEALLVRVQVNSANDAWQLYLRECEAADTALYTAADKTDTTWYLTSKRTADITFEHRIYSDSGRESLVDTLAVAVPSGRAYQHVMACVSLNDGQARSITGEIENLDLNEAVAFIPYPYPRGLRGGHSALTGGLI